MKLSLFGRLSMALFASLALGLGMTACGGGTIGYMWVLGQQYNNIAGFKIDDYTGNLTQIIHSPFASNGSVPVSIVIKPGGRYVYVINQGVGGTSTAAGTGQNIALFAVGGDGTLNFQQSYYSQGYISQWAQMDSSGSYLFVLDKYGPATGTAPNLVPDPNGAITVFAADSSTGRLSLVTNSTNNGGNPNTTTFPVGQSPFQMVTAGSCLFTLNSADQTITPLTISSGQLVPVTTGVYTITPAPSNITSITASGNTVYLTDGKGNSIYQLPVGSNCAFSSSYNTSQTIFPEYAGLLNPVWTLVATTSSGTYLYVLNQSSTSTITGTPFSSISTYSITTTSASQQLQSIAGGPYGVGSGPVCMVEDPSKHYMYVSNHNDGTLTGKILDSNTGELSQLSRGSTFTATGQLACLAVTGSIN
jgi:6-phosphogluconolactonase (cycloisomerase 2 family)